MVGATRLFAAEVTHPFRRATTAFLVAAALLPLAIAPPASADPLPADTWVTDGDVDAMAIVNGKVYIGGDFSQVGPNTGGGAEVDSTTGIYDSAFDRIDGVVNAVVSDGSGGWYIGGDFSYVDGLSRPRAAHIGADGAVTSWRPNVTSGSVNALYREGTALYLGGDFASVAGAVRNNLAAVDISSESAQLLSWDPDANGVVHTIASDAGGGVFVGGEFTIVGGAGRQRLAQIDVATGTIGGWAPGADATVRALAVAAGIVYVGGDFTTAGGSSRDSVAGIDPGTGSATAWNPGTNGAVHAIDVDGSEVLLGGSFSSAGGVARANLAAIDAAGVATAWDPSPDGAVNSVVVNGSQIMVGGAFVTIAGSARNRAASLDGSGDALAFDPDANGVVNAVGVDGARAYLGGSFNSVNGVARPFLAALDATTGVVDSAWTPVADAAVLALEPSSDGSVIFVGGAFTTINGEDHRRIAAVDAATGTIDQAFFAQANNRVHALHVADGVLYIGGDFGSVSSTTRRRIAAMDETTGTLDPAWDPIVDDSVRDIATSPDGSLVYLGGLFDDIDGFPRDEIAAVDAATGLVDPTWNPNTNRRVYEFEVTANEVLVAMGGGGGRVYSFDPTSGSTNWVLAVDGDVQTLATRGSHVYAGGHFLNAGVEPRQFFLAADLATGALEGTWDPKGSGGLGPFTMVEDGGRIWTGGEFVEVEGRSAGRVTYLDAIIFAPPGSYRDRVLADGADVYYRFGEASGSTALDEAGTLDATYSGGVSLGSSGLIVDANTAVDFDGVSGQVAIPDSGLINTGGPFEQRTIELWFAANDVSARQVLYEEGGATRGMNLYIEGARLYFGAWNTSDNGDGTTPWPAPVFLSAPISAGQTYHAALTFDFAASLTAYLNGVLIDESSDIGRLFAHGNDVAAGGVAGSTRYEDGTSSQSSYFAGTADELAIYNSHLTAAEVAGHYLLGGLSSSAPAALVVDPGEGAIVGGTVIVQAAAEDAEDVLGSLSVEISTDGGASWSNATYQAASGAYEYPWDTTAVGDGATAVLARATDADQNQGLSPSVNVIVDNVNAPPVVSVAAPADGATVAGTVAVDIDATDQEDAAGTLDVAVRFDGGPWQAAAWQSGLGLYRYDWDTTALPEGEVTIEARAIDSQLAETLSAAITVTVAGPAEYPTRVAADGADLHWRLGEGTGTTATESINGIDGSYVGSPGLGASGLIANDPDRAVAFDGANDVVHVPDDPLVNTGGPYETTAVELWFNADEVNARGVLYEQGGTSRGLSLYVEGGELIGGFWNVTNNGDGTTPWPAPRFVSTPIAAGVDHHVVLTYDFGADSIGLYVDGLPRDSVSGIGRLFSHGSDAAIGAMRQGSRFETGGASGAGFHFDGTIDEVAKYNAGLPASAVAAHFQIGSGSGTGPVVEIVGPTPGSTVAGTVDVAVLAADDVDATGTLDVEISVDDGVNWATASFNPGSGFYEWPWDTTAVPNGAVTVQARATDSTPTTTTAVPVGVTVDNATGYAAEVLADSPAVFWRLDETGGSTAADEVGGLDGTYSNGVLLGLAGLVNDGTSVAFDGTDDHVAVPDSTLINLGDPIEARTVELWFSAADVSARQVLYEEGGNSRGINVFVDDGSLYYGAWNRTAHGDGTTPWAGGEIFLSTPVSADTVYHVVLTLDQPSDVLIAYLDGVPVASSGGIGRLYAHGSDIGVGAMINQARFPDGGKSGDGFYLDGQLDEIAIYHSVLSAARIAAHFAAGE